jgi:hypothetical protein
MLQPNLHTQPGIQLRPRNLRGWEHRSVDHFYSPLYLINARVHEYKFSGWNVRNLAIHVVPVPIVPAETGEFVVDGPIAALQVSGLELDLSDLVLRAALGMAYNPEAEPLDGAVSASVVLQQALAPPVRVGCGNQVSNLPLYIGCEAGTHEDFCRRCLFLPTMKGLAALGVSQATSARTIFGRVGHKAQPITFPGKILVRSFHGGFITASLKTLLADMPGRH